MSQWIVTQGNHQFTVDSLDELEDLARQGRLSAGDMVQPPGTTEWIYASEIEELAPHLTGGGSVGADDLDDYRPSSGGSTTQIIMGVLIALIVVGGGAIFYYAQQLPQGNERLIGAGGLQFSEMIVTERGTGLRGEPDDRSRIETALKKDAVLELLAKRGDWYRARTGAGVEGWIPFDHVIPMYMLAGSDVREEYDPLYNPDRYVDVRNATWRQLLNENPRPGQEYSDITVFEFMMRNESVYDMTDLVIEATIKDAKGHELQTVEIAVEGLIPADGYTMVGTIAPDGQESRFVTTVSFQEMAKDDPDLQLVWSDGVEVPMGAQKGVNAEINVVELRAVPTEEAVEAVTAER